MDDAIDRSVDLLTDPARELFARFGLLRGGTDLSGVRSVCADDGVVMGVDVVDALRELVDASLIQAERTPAGTWYRMLFPIQANASARAAESAESDAVLHRLVRHVIAEVRHLSSMIEGSDPVPGVAGFERLAPAIRQVYGWLDAADDRSGVHELLAAIGPVTLTATNALPEATDWLALARPHLATAPLDHRLRIELGVLWHVHMSTDDYMELAERSVELAHTLDDRAMLVVAMAMLVDGHTDRDSDRSVELGREMTAIAREGELSLFGLALNFVLNPMLRTRRLEEAEQLLDEGFALGPARLGVFEPQLLYQAGRLALARGDLDAADVYYRESMQAAIRQGTLHGRTYALLGQAMVATARGELRVAQSLFLTTFEFDRVVSQREVWGSLVWAAIVSVDLGDEATIRRCIDEFVRLERPLEQCAYQVTHACLHLVLGDVVAARDHLLRAMDGVADVASIQWFGELISLWRRTVDPAAVDRIEQLREDVLDRTVAPRAAIPALLDLPALP
jgi:hypothetical protein